MKDNSFPLWCRSACFALPILVASAAFAASPQDEQVVRTAYAKLAYAVQVHTVYTAAHHPNLTASELAKQIQANEVRFQITDMTSGPLSEIADRPYSDFVAVPDGREVLQIAPSEVVFNDKVNGIHTTSNLATVSWGEAQAVTAGSWDIPVRELLTKGAGQPGWPTDPTRYVTATVTVSFQGKTRTYHTLWLFGSSGFIGIDTVANSTEFAKEGLFPSVLTDNRLNSRPVVREWLESNKRIDSTCKTGKVDVCCDAATMACGVAAPDLESTKPAPTTKNIAKEGGLRER